MAEQRLSFADFEDSAARVNIPKFPERRLLNPEPVAGELFRDGEARRGFGSSFGNILKFAFELKNMVCHIFWPKAKRSKATHGKRP